MNDTALTLEDKLDLIVQMIEDANDPDEIADMLLRRLKIALEVEA